MCALWLGRTNSNDRTPNGQKTETVKMTGIYLLSLLKNAIWLEIGSRVKIGMRIFINRMEHLVSLVRPGHLNPFGRHCIRTPRLQGGTTLDTEIGVSLRWRKSSRSPALVAMMQSTDLWERDDLAYIESVNGAALRTILVEREMGSGLVIIAKIR
jgi:hypothetical protein